MSSIAEPTAARVHPHPSWTLPHRQYESRPSDPQDRAEWRAELLVGEYCDTDGERFLDLLADSRPDLTAAQLFEAVETLCTLSVELAGYEVRSELLTGAGQVAAREYQAALSALATRPGAR